MQSCNPDLHEELYQAYAASAVATASHLPYLRKLAEDADYVIELGVNHGASSSALAFCRGALLSYDLVLKPRAKKLKRAIGQKWTILMQDTTQESPKSVRPHDILFVDSLHTYQQVVEELRIFAPVTRERIVFHDTITFGVWGANKETGEWLQQPVDRALFCPQTHGIRLAVDQFMIQHPEWQIERHEPSGHGLLTLVKK